LIIAIDYDGTYTADPELWDKFIKNAKDRDHEVWCVTMRYPEQGADVEKSIGKYVDKVYYTSMKAKANYLINLNLDRLPNIWIDDNPQAVTNDWPGPNTIDAANNILDSGLIPSYEEMARDNED